MYLLPVVNTNRLVERGILGRSPSPGDHGIHQQFKITISCMEVESRHRLPYLVRPKPQCSLADITLYITVCTPYTSHASADAGRRIVIMNDAR